MPKKNLIEEALIEAQELEKASIENAKDIVLESFAPDFVNFFKDVLNESEDNDEDDMPFDSDPEEEELKEGEDYDAMSDEEKAEYDKKMKKEGNEHDMGKEPDPGRQGTDPAVDDSEETLPQDDKDDPLKEGSYDDVAGDPTPEKGQAGLPKKGQPKTKKVGDSGWEDEGTAGYAADDPEKTMDDVQGGSPKPKKVGKGGWEAEHEGGTKHSDVSDADPEKNADQLPGGTPKAPVKVAEADEADEDKEKLDVPDDLFDDEKDITKEADEPEIKDDFDGADDEVEIEIDDEKDDTNEGVEIEIDDSDEEEKDEDAKEEVDENLYVRESNGSFKKITPAEYLKTRIDTLEEEKDKLTNAVESLQGQLQETHLFNAKLAHLNKLYMTGAFTNSEKERIAERLDECDTLDDVKGLYKTIISEVKNTNPLDDFSNLIKENRLSRNTKTENIYESADVSRMKRIMNYEFEGE